CWSGPDGFDGPLPARRSRMAGSRPHGGPTMNRNAALWAFLERYHEFLVNGLDLVSFLLITPEAVLLVRPFIRGKSGIQVLRFSTAIFTTYIAMFAGNTFLRYCASELTFVTYTAR